MMKGVCLCALAVLLSTCQQHRVGAVQLQDTKFALTFHVEKSEFERALEETDALVKYAEEKKMSKNTIMLMRAANSKVSAALDEFRKKVNAEKEAEERAKKNTSPPLPAAFTDKEIGVKALKGEAKKCNIKRYKAAEAEELLASGKVDLKKPFIVIDGVNSLEDMKRQFTAETLMMNTEAQLRYLSPAKAKAGRSFDKQQGGQVPDEERLEYSMVGVDKYFVNCFNFKAKPDFRKSGGADTEHCEQVVPAAYLSSNVSDYTFATISKHLGFLQMLDAGRNEFISKASDLQLLVHETADIKQTLARGASRFLVFGPAGSGEQLRQEGMPFVDGLVHGKRRWFIMSPKDFMKLRETAKDALEPASAFMFFEQQLEELMEDHGLGGKKMKFWECNQEPGELIYIPGETIMTSLSLIDSFSHKHNVAHHETQVLQKVNSAIWAPESGQIPFAYQYGACFEGLDLDRAGEKLGVAMNPMQGQIIAQIMQQYYPTPQAQNMLIINVLSECTSVYRSEALSEDKTYCPKIWSQCASQLESNAKKMGQPFPGWITVDAPKASPKAEL